MAKLDCKLGWKMKHLDCKKMVKLDCKMVRIDCKMAKPGCKMVQLGCRTTLNHKWVRKGYE